MDQKPIKASAEDRWDMRHGLEQQVHDSKLLLFAGTRIIHTETRTCLPLLSLRESRATRRDARAMNGQRRQGLPEAGGWQGGTQPHAPHQSSHRSAALPFVPPIYHPTFTRLLLSPFCRTHLRPTSTTSGKSFPAFASAITESLFTSGQDPTRHASKHHPCTHHSRRSQSAPSTLAFQQSLNGANPTTDSRKTQLRRDTACVAHSHYQPKCYWSPNAASRGRGRPAAAPLITMLQAITAQSPTSLRTFSTRGRLLGRRFPQASDQHR